MTRFGPISEISMKPCRYANTTGINATTLCDAASSLAELQLRNLSPFMELFICIAYTFLIAMGVVLNCICIFVVIRQRWRNRELPHVGYYRSRNLYILNLAIADLLVCLLELPFTLIRLVAYSWHFGTLFCKLIPFIQATNIVVAACTVMIIAIDRYNIIVRSPKTTSFHLKNHPRHALLSKYRLCNVNTTIALIWLFSMLISSPIFFHTQLIKVTTDNLRHYDKCTDIWSSRKQKTIFTIILTLVQFLVPFCVITAMHWKITMYLNRHLKRIPQPVIQVHSPNGDQIEEGLIIHPDDPTNMTNSRCLDVAENRKSSICSENSQRSAKSFNPENSPTTWKRARRGLRRNRRTTIFLICIAAIFAASWLPLNIFQLYTNFSLNSLETSTHLMLFAFCHLLAMSSVCVNPFLYGFLNTNFRKEFSLVLTSCSSVCWGREKSSFINNNISNKNLNGLVGRKKDAGVIMDQRNPNCMVVTLLTNSNNERYL